MEKLAEVSYTPPQDNGRLRFHPEAERFGFLRVDNPTLLSDVLAADKHVFYAVYSFASVHNNTSFQVLVKPKDLYVSYTYKKTP